MKKFIIIIRGREDYAYLRIETSSTKEAVARLRVSLLHEIRAGYSSGELFGEELDQYRAEVALISSISKACEQMRENKAHFSLDNIAPLLWGRVEGFANPDDIESVDLYTLPFALRLARKGELTAPKGAGVVQISPEEIEYQSSNAPRIY